MAVTSAGTGSGLPPIMHKQLNAIDNPEQWLAINAAMSFDYRMADLSIYTSEQVEFLLTPALLVQELQCEDVVLTYPEE